MQVQWEVPNVMPRKYDLENQLRRDSLLGKLTALGTEMHRALEGPRGSCAAITGGSTAAKVMEMWTKRRSGEF